MSRRSFPRVAAAGALAVAGLMAFPLAAQAQSPNPWRSDARTVAPAPRPVASNDFELDLPVAARAPRVTFRTAVPTCPSGACTPAAVVVQSAPTTVTRAALVATPSSKPTGNWCRELPGMVVGVCFRGDEVRLTFDHNIGGTTACMTLVGDYAVTRDGTVHGVITGTDIRQGGKTSSAQAEIGDVYQILQTFVDQPFAFRCRMSDGTLMVSNWRIACAKGESQDFGVQLGMIAGIFQPVSGAMPQPRPASEELKPVPAGGVSFVQPVELAPPPVNVNLSPALLAPQPCPVPLVPGLQPSLPPPPEVRGMMVEAFGQMMNQMPPPYAPPGVCLPPGVRVPQGVQAFGPPPIPTGVYTAPPMLPAPPPPPAPPMPAAARGGKMPIGTWTREMGPIQYSMTVKEGYLDLTLTLSTEDGGKTVTVHHSLTADCYLTRSGDGLVGVLTGMDISVDGKSIEESDLNSLAKDLPKLQQEIAEKPFAMTFRVYDDMLVIGNVRLPSTNESTGVREIFGMIAGRYQRTNGPAPKPVPMRVTRAASTCDGPQCTPASRPPVPAPPAVTIQPVDYRPVHGGVQSHPSVPPMPAPTALPQYVPPALE